MKSIISLFVLFCLFVLPSPGRAASVSAACIVTMASPTKRNVEEIKTLKIFQGNVENWFRQVGEFGRVSATEMVLNPAKGPNAKSEYDRKRIRDMFQKEDPDIAIIEEIEDIVALRELGGEDYEAFLIEGNDSRGIDIGMLVKRDLPIVVEYRTNKDRKWFDPVEKREIPLFSRDLPVAILRLEGEASPFMAVIGNHAKSKRNRPDIHEHSHAEGAPPPVMDPESYIWRQAQYEGAAKILEELADEFGEDLPLVMGGDFNTEVSFSPEVAPLWARLRDGFDLAPVTVPQGKRITQTYHPRKFKNHHPNERHSEPFIQPPTVYSQLDALLANSPLQDQVLEMKILPYVDENGHELPIPKTYQEREKNPSDHFFLVMTLAAQGLFKRSLKNQPFRIPEPPAYIPPPQTDRRLPQHCPPGRDCSQQKPVLDYIHRAP